MGGARRKFTGTYRREYSLSLAACEAFTDFPAAASSSVHLWATPWGAQVYKTVDCTELWSPHGEMGGNTPTNYSSWTTPHTGYRP